MQSAKQAKFWFVALNEYRKHVFQKRFILAIISVPALLSVTFLVGFLTEYFNRNMDPIGYVDQAGALADTIPIPEGVGNSQKVDFLAFADQESAEQALEAGEIQAYYLIPQAYALTREVSLVYIEEPGMNAEDDFFDFLRTNLSGNLPERVQILVLDGFDVTVRSLDGSREFSEKYIFNLILPVVFGFLFTFVLTSGSGYLSNAVTEEKENRTIEILSTSMSANQFILGKVLGIVMVIFTQVISWIMFFVLAYFGARAAFDAAWIDHAQIDYQQLLVLVMLFIPAFFFFSGIALTISSMVTDSSEGQQMIGIISMPVGFSYWFAFLIISNPGSVLSTILSLIPFTLPTLMPLRLAFGLVPWWQILLGVGITTLGAFFTIWLAARAYEIGMMQYGKRIRLGELLRNSSGGGAKK
ncbi:MAG: ABC transporter permease [Anaerolineales bacterium]|nr:ABC transporter permease [Anaerolineales bacterium]